MDIPTSVSEPHSQISWQRFLLTTILGIIALWVATKGIAQQDVINAFASVRWGYVVLANLIFLVTLGAKAKRWQALYFPHKLPAFTNLFWAMMAGQFLNVATPIRVGEVARIVGLEKGAPGIKAQTLGTIVVEKSLDALFVVVTLLLVLPFVVVPNWLKNSAGPTMLIVTTGAVLFLYLIAYQTTWFIELVQKVSSKMPAWLSSRINKIAISGLEGLSALRNKQQNLQIIGMTTIIAILGILPPYFLFKAFNLSLGFASAALIHSGLTIGLTPPSTPGKVIIFEAFTITLLLWLGIENKDVALSFAVVFHMIIILPQILLGMLAIFRFDWRFSDALGGRL